VSVHRVQISDPRVEAYIRELAEAEGPGGLPPGVATVLRELEESAQRESMPIVGPLGGRLLMVFAGLTGGRRMFAAGSGAGYAAIWLAAGAGPGAQIQIVDSTPEGAARSKDAVDRAGLRAQVDATAGGAATVLARENGLLDLVFNDAEKGSYPYIARAAFGRLRPGGVYIAGHALWYGKVCLGGTTWDGWTTAVAQHNRDVFGDDAAFATLVDQGEGLVIAVKRAG
jgi:predicted O-methyltransferase YrrM